MIKKVYLLWHAYKTDEMLVIGSLTELNNKKYMFKYEEDAEKALSLGCFLPFAYTDEEMYFEALPHFFEQRMLKSKYNIEKFGINYENSTALSILTYGDSIKNTDNFRVISEQSFEKMKTDEKNTKNKVSVRKY